MTAVRRVADSPRRTESRAAVDLDSERNPMLSQEQIAFFNENGYVRIPQVYTPAEVEAQRAELDQLIQDWSTTNMGWSGPWRSVYMSPDVEKRSMLTHLHDLHFYSEAWCQAVTNRRLAAAPASLLGPNVE